MIAAKSDRIDAGQRVERARPPATLRRLFFGPPLYLRLQPELDATIPEIQDRPRHVGVPVLIHADRVAVGESKDLGHAVRVEKVVEIYVSTHAT